MTLDDMPGGSYVIDSLRSGFICWICRRLGGVELRFTFPALAGIYSKPNLYGLGLLVSCSPLHALRLKASFTPHLP